MNKHKRIPILPTQKWEDGAMANDCPLRVGVFVVVVCVCVFGIGVCFLA